MNSCGRQWIFPDSLDEVSSVTILNYRVLSTAYKNWTFYLKSRQARGFLTSKLEFPIPFPLWIYGNSHRKIVPELNIPTLLANFDFSITHMSIPVRVTIKLQQNALISEYNSLKQVENTAR